MDRRGARKCDVGSRGSSRPASWRKAIRHSQRFCQSRCRRCLSAVASPKRTVDGIGEEQRLRRRAPGAKLLGAQIKALELLRSRRHGSRPRNR